MLCTQDYNVINYIGITCEVLLVTCVVYPCGIAGFYSNLRFLKELCVMTFRNYSVQLVWGLKYIKIKGLTQISRARASPRAV